MSLRSYLRFPQREHQGFTASKEVGLQLIVFTALYSFYFTRQFLRGDIVLGGDTQLLWSLNYLSLHSLREHAEFLWWDPTALNGWPAYVNLTAGWFNYLSPYTLPSLILAQLGGMAGVSINSLLVLQKTTYYFVLNVLAVILISHEIIFNRVARWLPPLLFTLSAVVFAGFRDSVLWEAMPAPLYLLFGLIYFNKHRTPLSCFVLLATSVFMFAGLNYAALQAALWWLGGFMIFLFALHSELLGVTRKVIAEINTDERNRRILRGMLLLLLLAVGTFFVTLTFNLGNILRPNLNSVITYDTGVAGNFGVGEGVLSHPLWTNFLMWAPNGVLHDMFLRFDIKGTSSAGVDHRYIGLVTLPLLFIAVFRGYRNRILWVLLLTAATCLLFVTLTYHNLLIRSLMESVGIFRNIRTIADTLPRDVPAVLLMLCAGIGLDELLRHDKNLGARSRQTPFDQILFSLLVFLLAVALVNVFLSFIPFDRVFATENQGATTSSVSSNPFSYASLRDAFAHIGIFLFILTTLCLLMLRARNFRDRLAVALLVTVFIEMTLSASSYWDRGKVWFENAGPHALPSPAMIGPVDSTLATWPGSYGGFIHNPFSGPFIGLKPWMVLETRASWRSVLENWSAEHRLIKKYPDFRFFSVGRFIPFEEIRTIDALQAPGHDVLFVHDQALAWKGTREERLETTWKVLEFTPNHLRISVDMPRRGIMLNLDNYDRFWTARVDGKSANLYRANFTFKALEVPAGKHVVELRYDPYPIKIVWAVFYVALLTFLACVVLRIHLLRSVITASIVLAVFWGGMHATSAISKRVASMKTHDLTHSLLPGAPIVVQSGYLELPSSNSRLRVEQGTAGSVESATVDEYGMSTVRGWAVDQKSSAPALGILATIGNRVWFVARTNLDRPDIVQGLGPAYSHSGFVAWGRGANKNDLLHLRAFAILRDGTVRELGYAPTVTRSIQ